MNIWQIAAWGFYSFLTWTEPLGKSKVQMDISIEEYSGSPGRVALRSYFHWYLEADQTWFSGIWGAAFPAGWHKSIQKNLAPSRAVKVTLNSKRRLPSWWNFHLGVIIPANNLPASLGMCWQLITLLTVWILHGLCSVILKLCKSTQEMPGFASQSVCSFDMECWPQTMLSFISCLWHLAIWKDEGRDSQQYFEQIHPLLVHGDRRVLCLL